MRQTAANAGLQTHAQDSTIKSLDF